MAKKYEVYELPKKKKLKGILRVRPDDEYPPKYKVYKRSRPRRPSAARKGVK